MSKYVLVDRVKVVATMAGKNVTSVELAQRAGVGRSAVQSMRCGRRVWRNTAQHVAAALGVPLEELLEKGGADQ